MMHVENDKRQSTLIHTFFQLLEEENKLVSKKIWTNVIKNLHMKILNLH